MAVIVQRQYAPVPLASMRSHGRAWAAAGGGGRRLSVMQGAVVEDAAAMLTHGRTGCSLDLEGCVSLGSHTHVNLLCYLVFCI